MNSVTQKLLEANPLPQYPAVPDSTPNDGRAYKNTYHTWKGDAREAVAEVLSRQLSGSEVEERGRFSLRVLYKGNTYDIRITASAFRITSSTTASVDLVGQYGDKLAALYNLIKAGF